MYLLLDKECLLTGGSDSNVFLELRDEAEECFLLANNTLEALTEDIEPAEGFDLD